MGNKVLEFYSVLNCNTRLLQLTIYFEVNGIYGFLEPELVSFKKETLNSDVIFNVGDFDSTLNSTKRKAALEM